MAKINAMLDIGKRSLMNSQTALQTVAHNIASKTTEGYSRQRVEQLTNPPVGEGSLLLGMGARAALVTRVNNPFLEKQLQKESGQLGYLDGQAESLRKVEEIFNEQTNKGLNQYLTDFFNTFRELSNNPESIAIRTMVKEAGVALANDFSRVNRQLSETQKDIDLQIHARIQDVNRMTQELASLNEKIAAVEIQGIPANDQRDRREVLLKKMNELIDIKVAEGDQGMITVSTAGNAILVSGYESTDLSTYTDPISDRLEISYRPTESHPAFKITDRITGGQVGGSIVIRDHVIQEMKDKVNETAYVFAKEINDAHVLGFDRNGKQGNLFFEDLDQINNAAGNIKVSEKIQDDVGKIAAAGIPGAPGDNTIANIISLVQYKEVMDGNTATLDDFYNSQVGRIGVISQRAYKARDAQSNILEQVHTLRESVSGVSLDEEATKMIEHQKAFDASARIIRTADEMFDTLLNLKRV